MMDGRPLRLSEETIALLGTRTGGDTHRVIALTDADLDGLCGYRGEWLLLLREPTQEELNMIWKPLLVASTPQEIQEMQRTGEKPKTRPVIYVAQQLRRLYP